MPLPLSVQRLVARLYGRPVIRNSARGELVEELVLMALEPDWQLTGDWHECDLLGPDQLRIQVKQAAARQNWHEPTSTPSRGQFQIKHKSGRFLEDGATWIEERSRNAEIFVFAWHPTTDENADHREPEQWRFYVVAEANLPDQQSVKLARVQALSPEYDHASLRGAVARVAASLLKQGS